MAPSAKIAEVLAQAVQQTDKAAAYQSILAKIKELSSPATAADDLAAVAESFLDQGVGIVATRSLLAVFVDTLKALNNEELWLNVGSRTLALLAAQATTFPDTIAALRELVATAHENNEDFAEAAASLAEIPLDSSQRKVTPEEKARIWIRIVRNFLEVDDSTLAETYINKLKNIMHEVQNQDLNLHFKLSQARIQDANRDFLGAAQKYHELSFSLAIAEEERLHTLGMAIKCAILAPAGPMRSRTLGRLYKDERSVQLPEFGILEKIFLDRLLSASEVAQFAEGLQPHQLATTSDGSTVLAKAVMEHNLLGASRLYNNITFEALGVLLGLDADKAEETTARMIEQGRLVGRMDQLDSMVYFEGGEASGQKGSGRAEVHVGKETQKWDANVAALSEEVENITNALHERFPVGLPSRIVHGDARLTQLIQRFVEAKLAG
jgi:COP9 signalosome complex subunit 4